MVTLFKYQGWVLTASYDNWSSVVGNLWKAWKSWARLERIIVMRGSNPQVTGIFFKELVQEVLLFDLDMWVMIPNIQQALRSSQNRVTRRIIGSSQSNSRMGTGSTHQCRQKWRRRGLKICDIIS